MAEHIGHFFVKIFFDFLFGFVFLAGFAGHHEIALDELPHFFLQFEDIPVAISADAKLFGVGIGDFFDKPGHFVDVHSAYYILV